MYTADQWVRLQKNLDDVNGKLGAYYNVQNPTESTMNGTSMTISSQYQGGERSMAAMRNAPNVVVGNNSDKNSSLSVPNSDSGGKKMPRNSSVDNFWLLVDIGDLPQPETSVLEKTLFNPEQPQSGTLPGGQMNTENGITHHNNSNDRLLKDNTLNDVDKGHQQQYHLQRQQHQFVPTANDSSSNNTAINNTTALKVNPENNANEVSMASSVVSGTSPTTPIVEKDTKTTSLASVEYMNATTDGSTVSSSTDQPSEVHSVESATTAGTAMVDGNNEDLKDSSDDILKDGEDSVSSAVNCAGEKRKISSVADE